MTLPGLATHILGRTGKINAEEYEANKDLGYGYNDIIGKQGIEKWGEQYLRGIDGTTGTTKEVNGKEIAVMNDAEPVPGDYIDAYIGFGFAESGGKIACRYNTKYSCVKRCESKGRCRL